MVEPFRLPIILAVLIYVILGKYIIGFNLAQSQPELTCLKMKCRDTCVVVHNHHTQTHSSSWSHAASENPPFRF